MKYLIPEAIFGCFYKMTLRKSVTKILSCLTWNNHGLRKAFIYATTVLKFVGADYCSPTKQLELELKPDPSAFSDLDQLYTQILSVYPSAVNIVQVLGFITAFDNKKLPEVVEDIPGMEEGQLKQILRGLSSLMKDENNENGGGLE